MKPEGSSAVRRALVRVRAGIACAAVLTLAVAVATVRATVAPHPVADGVSLGVLVACEADSLDVALRALERVLAETGHDPGSSVRTRQAFALARRRYKHLEPVVEFYAPALAAAFNSRRQEVDDDDAPPPWTLSASGFPALEILLYPVPASTRRDSARKVLAAMRPLVGRVRGMAPSLVATSAQIVEIARLELARISTLGIAGFDTPLTHAAMPEAVDALEGTRRLLHAAGPALWPTLQRERSSLDSALAAAAAYVRANHDFASFNRLAFIAVHLQPATNALDELRRAGNVRPLQLRRGWRADAPSVYSPRAFDARAYAPSGAPLASPTLVALGAALFSERALSGNGSRSCASCHHPERGFTDGLATPANIVAGGPPVRRHTPSLWNAALEPAQFADERSPSLEDQVFEVLRSPAEMGSSDALAVAALRRRAPYTVLFGRAFNEAEGAASITGLRLRQALAAYERTLVGLDTRFDRAVRGDTGALTARERLGFTLFMGKAGCGTCHFAPLFSGNTPPLYVNADVEVIGTPRRASGPASIDGDSGRAGIDHLPQHVHAFRTPSLRGSGSTGPYMHNGVFRTLDEVLRFYDGGGGAGAGGPMRNQTLSRDSLRLTRTERRAIIAFLGVLNSTGEKSNGLGAGQRSRRTPPAADAIASRAPQ